MLVFNSFHRNMAKKNRNPHQKTKCKKSIPQKFNTYLNTIFPYFSPHCWADGYTISYKKVELTVKN